MSGPHRPASRKSHKDRRDWKTLQWPVLHHIRRAFVPGGRRLHDIFHSQEERLVSALFDILMSEDLRASNGRINGVVVGVVTNNQDPDGMGRVKVKFPWLSDQDESHWARVAAPMAGKERGFYFLPEVEDEVLVAFEHGDARFPYVLGALWNGKEGPPAKNDDGKNNIRVIKSRSGHIIRLTDEDGK